MTKPKLVLVLSIDQMRFDYLTRFNSLYKGGLRRLLDQGAVFTNAKYRHANTETGPGHSVILSGTPCVAFRHCCQHMVRPAPQEEHQRC